MPKKALLGAIRFYRHHLSALKRHPTCRFIPTCSEYALEAVEKYGFLKGGLLALKRILKCHPFHPGGYDPLP
ncbi:MAG: membrane protein insertion efficiency factor YidD [Clostridiales bacterium]|nr:membrane protein insertion efficiency factor YidD [Clostridiales bacterium]